MQTALQRLPVRAYGYDTDARVGREVLHAHELLAALDELLSSGEQRGASGGLATLTWGSPARSTFFTVLALLSHEL